MATSAGAVYVDVKANTNPFERQMSGLGGIASKIGGMLAGALGTAAVVSFGKQCTELASELTEVQNVVDQVFPHMSDQVNAWSHNLIESFGLSETKAKQYASTLGSMARSMGMSEEQAYAMGTSMAELAGDIASFYDMSSDEAYEKLQSVFTGMVQPLRSLGINMTQASLDAFALANGFGKTVSEMSDAEVALLRYQYVLDRTSYAQGDFARTNQTWANQLRILSMRFDELKIAIGNSLIVVLTPVIQVINTIIAALTQAANAVYRFVSALASTGIAKFARGAAKAVSTLTGRTSDMGEASESAAASTGTLSGASGDAAKAAGKQAKAQEKLNRTLAGFDRINKLAAQSAAAATGGTGGGVGGIDALGGGLDLGLDTATEGASLFQDVLDSIEIPPKLLDAIEHLREAAGRLGDTLSGGLSWAWEHVLKPLGEWTISELAPRLVDLLANAFDVLSGALEALGPVFEFVWENFLEPLAGMFGEALLGVLDGLNAALEGIAGYIRDTLVPAIQRGKDITQEAIDAFKEYIGLDKKMSRYDKRGTSLKRGVLGVSTERTRVQAALGSSPTPSWGSLLKMSSGGSGGDLGILHTQLSNTIDMTRTLSAVWGTIDSKVVRLTAKNDTKAGVDAAKSKVAELKDKAVTMSAKNSVDTAVDAANQKIATLKDKTATLKATDNASSKIDAVNKKALKDHSAKLNFTPVLTKSTIKISTLSKGQIKLSTFAQGGWVERNTPRIAVIGDNRREGEIVSPESKFQGMLDKAVEQGGGGAAELLPTLRSILAAVEGLDTATYLDGRAISRSVVSDINRQVQSTGRSPLLA